MNRHKYINKYKKKEIDWPEIGQVWKSISGPQSVLYLDCKSEIDGIVIWKVKRLGLMNSIGSIEEKRLMEMYIRKPE